MLFFVFLGFWFLSKFKVLIIIFGAGWKNLASSYDTIFCSTSTILRNW
jgi:hypothetical protein